MFDIFMPVCHEVDSTFTYAYTLLGHEYATTDELEKAKMSLFSQIG